MSDTDMTQGEKSTVKVLQINNVYGRLSTGKIVADLHHTYQSMGIDAYVCYGRGPAVQETNIQKVCWETYAKLNKIRAMLSGVMYSGCHLSTSRLIHVIKQLNPDVVHLHCINDNFVNIYRLLEYLGRKQIPTVVTLHAEFMHTGTCGYYSGPLVKTTPSKNFVNKVTRVRAV